MEDNKKTVNRSFKKDLTGMQFGYLTAMYYVPRGHWHCKCKCGNEVDVDTRMLNSGRTKSCGCLVKEINSKNNTIDMTGYENPHIKVLKRAGSTKDGTALWVCKCKYCGKEFIARGAAVRFEHIQSCGCMKHRAANEDNIAKLFDENGIEYKRQYTFADLRGEKNKRLKFDFAVFKDGKLSHLIEQNGSSHMRKSALVSLTFAAQQKRDAMKKEYCKNNNIELRIINGYNYTLEDLI